jgi:hypothetical protein
MYINEREKNTNYKQCKFANQGDCSSNNNACKPNIKTLKPSFKSALIIIIIAAGILVFNAWIYLNPAPAQFVCKIIGGPNPAESYEFMSNFGQSFGFASAILAFLSILLILKTIRDQNIEP